MQTSAIIKPTFRGHLAGVNHVDNTTRPQILKKEHNPTLYNIILASGLPAILNTSFNYQEPIVETPEQAMATAEKMPIDALVIGEKIYEYK
jgi:carbamoyltransferase